MNLNHVIAQATSIHGAFSPAEMKYLYQFAAGIPENSVVVEIGSLCGRSSVGLGIIALENNYKFHCIDCFMDGAQGIADVRAEFLRNMNDRKLKYTLHDMKSQDAVSEIKEDIDFLFVDGDHRYRGVMQDIVDWLPKLKQGGYVFFHDYNSSWTGVKKAVDKLNPQEYKTIVSVDTMIGMQKLVNDLDLSWDKCIAVARQFNPEYSMQEIQQYLVYKECLKIPKGGIVLELGIAHGKTAALISYIAKRRGFHYHGIDDFSLTMNFDEVINHLKSFDLSFNIHRMKTCDMDWRLPIDLLIIDADHSEVGVKNDCEKYLPYVKHGGLAMFHDYDEPYDFKSAHWAIRFYADKHTKGWEDVDFLEGLKIFRKP